MSARIEPSQPLVVPSNCQLAADPGVSDERSRRSAKSAGRKGPSERGRPAGLYAGRSAQAPRSGTLACGAGAARTGSLDHPRGGVRAEAERAKTGREATPAGPVQFVRRLAGLHSLHTSWRARRPGHGAQRSESGWRAADDRYPRHAERKDAREPRLRRGRIDERRAVRAEAEVRLEGFWKVARILLLTILFVLAAVSSLAQEPEAPVKTRPSTVIIQEGISSQGGADAATHHDSADGVRAKILHLWFARKVALENGDTVEADARVEELRAYMLQEGITADRMVARGFAYEGYENLREGNYERSREAFDLARSFDPYLPQAQFGYAWSLLHAGRGVFTFLTEYRRGIGLVWNRFTTDEVQRSNVVVLMALALLCSMTAFTLMVIASCQGRVRHDLFEFARTMMPERGARVTAWTIFLLPLLVWAGGVWLILYWLALCFRY